MGENALRPADLGFDNVSGADGAQIKAGDLTIAGVLSPGVNPGEIATLKFDAELETFDFATYRCEIGSAGPWPTIIPFITPLPTDSGVPIGNDLLYNTSNDKGMTLVGTLDLSVIGELHDRQGGKRWYGKEDRGIVYVPNFGFPDIEELAVPEAGTELGLGVFLIDPDGAGDRLPVELDFLERTALVHLRQYAAGDATLDNQVSFADLWQVFVLSGKYGTTESATWSEGEVDGNGTIGFGDLWEIFVLSGLYGLGDVGEYPSDPKADAKGGDLATADLIVVPDEGVYIDTKGTAITAYQITSPSGALGGEAAENLGLFSADTDTKIAGLSGFSFEGRHFLGDVLGPDGVADLSGEYAVEGASGSFAFNVVVVPEPGTLALLSAGALGLLLLAARRLRRRA